ncbi:hypothetical protein ACROYT_G016845 [Oculina patagonica]
MKPACGIKTIKGVIAFGSLMGTIYFLYRMLNVVSQANQSCHIDESGCTKRVLRNIGLGVGGTLALSIAYGIIRQSLILCFPVACGHRRCIFTGRSSQSLREVLLSVDNDIPTEEQLQEFKDKALLYVNDIKTPLERKMASKPFQYILSGSAVERFGIPFMISEKKRNRGCCSCSYMSALYTDLDVMFFSTAHKATFSGQGNILIEPLINESEGFIGYAQLTSLTPGYEGQCVSSKVIRDQAKDAVGNARVRHLPGVPCCCGMCELTPKIKLDSKGPAIKINIAPLFEADITLCIRCSEWPTMSDWPTRPRYWPSVDEAQRIVSLGCHLVAKPAPSDESKTSWRFSFSLAEVELSKLVPDTARKCFLALKIILKDHLQPVVPEITSYHMKTIFLNTLEKVPVGFWVEGNIEECFLTLLAELRDALLSTNCPHHWFSFINLFNIEANELQRLAKKVNRIMKDPAPFIFDDGCCCLSPCCVRVPHNNFTPRSNEQFLADYDEVTLSADGHMMVDPGNHRHQFPVSPSPRSTQLNCRSYPNGIDNQGATIGPEELVVSLPPLQNAAQEPSFRPDEAEDDWFRDALPLLVILPPVQNV